MKKDLVKCVICNILKKDNLSKRSIQELVYLVNKYILNLGTGFGVHRNGVYNSKLDEVIYTLHALGHIEEVTRNPVKYEFVEEFDKTLEKETISEINLLLKFLKTNAVDLSVLCCIDYFEEINLMSENPDNRTKKDVFSLLGTKVDEILYENNLPILKELKNFKFLG